MASIFSGWIVRIGTAVGLGLPPVGCTTFSADGGFGGVESTVRKRLNQDVIWG